MIFLLIVSLLPLFFVVFLKDFYESFSTDDGIIVEGLCLIVTGILLTLACQCPDTGKNAASMKYSDALAIGLAQAIAPMPGISRSGSTVAVGMMMGLGKKFAVTFSFIMGIPAVLGAVILEIPEVVENGLILRCILSSSALSPRWCSACWQSPWSTGWWSATSSVTSPIIPSSPAPLW